MKNSKHIHSLLMIILSSFMFIQCTSDPIQGPPGVAGLDGLDGVNGNNGTNGIDGTANCVACHSDSHRDPIRDSYVQSGHFNQTKVSWAGNISLSEYVSGLNSDNSFSCAKCHTNEGFIEFQTTGSIAGYYDSPTGISCTGCHDSHNTFDFENDGQDFALRNNDPVDLIIGTGVLDFEGTSNSCVQCHQPRKTPPTDQGEGMFNVTPHYGPHYGAQSTMLEGIQGALIEGPEGYPGVASSTHRTDASCVSCHMGDANNNNNDGQHSFTPTLNSCVQCHTSATDFDINGTQTEVTNLMHELEELLVEKGILEATPWGDVDLVTGQHPVEIANAYWNWEFVHQDGSHGVHNPAYTKALLKNAIESMKK